jgi:hypothetical protein
LLLNDVDVVAGVERGRAAGEQLRALQCDVAGAGNRLAVRPFYAGGSDAD